MATRSYKKGYIAAASTFAAFSTKQEAILRDVLVRLNKQSVEINGALQDIEHSVNGLFDYLSETELETLYTIYTPFNLRELDLPHRRLLVGTLFTLSKTAPSTANQQAYLAAVMQYLNIPDIPQGTPLAAIGRVDSLSIQKGIYQAALEYLGLQDDDCYDRTEEQTAFLQAFSLSADQRAEIREYVETLFAAVGTDGVIGKYRVCANTPDPLFAEPDEPLPTPPTIPFFSRPVAIVYDPADAVADSASHLVLTAFNECIGQYQQACEVSRYSIGEYLVARTQLEKSAHIVFVGVSKTIRSLSKTMRWEQPHPGMRFGEEGIQYIIDAVPLKNKDLDTFIALVNEHKSRLNGRTVSSSVESVRLSFLKDIFCDNTPTAANVAVGILASPLLILGQLAELGAAGTQKLVNRSNKNDLLLVQYVLATAFFLESRVTPYV